MKQVATISTNGAEVTFDEGVFAIGGESVRIEQLIDYDKVGAMTWPSEDMKNWFYEVAATAAATATSTTQPVSAATTSRKPVWIAVIVIALLATIGVAIGLVVMAQNRAAEEAAAQKASQATEAAAQKASQAAELRSVYEKVAAVDSAVSVGINQSDYSAKVQDAKAAVDAYSPPDAAATAVADDLEAALAAYSLAASEWNDAIVSSYRSVDESKLQEYWATAGTLVESARGKLESYEAD